MFLTSGTFSEEPASASEVTDGTAETECKCSILLTPSNSVMHFSFHGISILEIHNHHNEYDLFYALDEKCVSKHLIKIE